MRSISPERSFPGLAVSTNSAARIHHALHIIIVMAIIISVMIHAQGGIITVSNPIMVI